MIARAKPKPIKPPQLGLLTPGVAEVTYDGILHLAGADLDWADFGGACRLSIDARVLVIAIRHGNQHAICACKPRGLVNARNELRALGVRLGLDPVTAKVVRHTDGHTRWLAVQFDTAQTKQQTMKNKAKRPEC